MNPAIKPGTRITAAMLREHHACSDQVAVFEKEWPKGTRLTKAALLRAAARGLDLAWFAQNFLKAPAWEVYQKATATAWEVYQKATAPAWEVYQKATAPAREVYDKAKATAREVYEKAKATALWGAIKEATP